MSVSRVSAPTPSTIALGPRDGEDAPAVSDTLDAPPPDSSAVATKLFSDLLSSPPDTLP